MLSIVISWRDRTGLHEPLARLQQAAERLAGDLTIVNFSGDSALLARELNGHGQRVRVVDVGAQRYFNKSAAQNIGAAHSRWPVLFFCDCDIVVEPAVVEAITRELTSSPGHFATLAGVRESLRNARGAGHLVSFGYQLRLATADGRRLEIVDHEEDARDGTRQAPGLLFVRREDFLAVDGYNSALHGWGWEDQDMIARLSLGQGLARVSRGHALHLSHDDGARVRHYPQADRWESRDRMFRTALANYDRADFQGSYARDLALLAERVVVHERGG
jgi:hypothetical protein